MEKMLVVESLDGQRVAEVQYLASGEFTLDCEDETARRAIEQLIERGHEIGLIHHQHQRQKTSQGEVFRIYGSWIKPGDPDFLEALADALVEFNLFGYTVELVSN